MRSAIAVFDKALDNYQTAMQTYKSAGDVLDEMNSNFVNQMKIMVEDMAGKSSDNLVKELKNYRDNVENVVNGFAEDDSFLARQIYSDNNPLFNRPDNSI